MEGSIEKILIAGFVCGWLFTVIYMSFVVIRFIARLIFPPDDTTDR